MVQALAILATITGIIMSLGHFPQALKIIKNKSSRDVSLTTYIVFTIGVFVWFFYGLSIFDIPLLVANGVAVVGCSFVLVVYFKYRK